MNEEFKVGDRVVVVNPHSLLFRKAGEVVDVRPGDGKCIGVRFYADPDRLTIPWYRDELELMTPGCLPDEMRAFGFEAKAPAAGVLALAALACVVIGVLASR